MAGLVAPKTPGPVIPESSGGAAVAADMEIQASRVISPAQRQQAASRAERIRQGLGDLARLAEEAWHSRDWEALGYRDWAAYSAAEFGPDRIGARKAVAE